MAAPSGSALLSPDAEVVVGRWLKHRVPLDTVEAEYSQPDRYMARMVRHLMGEDHSGADTEFGEWDETDDKALDLWTDDDETFLKARPAKVRRKPPLRTVAGRGGKPASGRKPGDPFRGNQHTGGIPGAKHDAATFAAVKGDLLMRRALKRDVIVRMTTTLNMILSNDKLNRLPHGEMVMAMRKKVTALVRVYAGEPKHGSWYKVSIPSHRGHQPYLPGSHISIHMTESFEVGDEWGKAFWADEFIEKARGKGKKGKPKPARVAGRPSRSGRRSGDPFRGNQHTGGISGPKRAPVRRARAKPKDDMVVGRFRSKTTTYEFKYRRSQMGKVPPGKAHPTPWERNPGGPNMKQKFGLTGSGKVGEAIVNRYFKGFRSALDGVHHQGAFDVQYDSTDLGVEIKLVSNNIQTVRPRFLPDEVRKKTAVAKHLGIRQRFGFLLVDIKRRRARLYIAKHFPPKSSHANANDYTYHGEASIDWSKVRP